MLTVADAAAVENQGTDPRQSGGQERLPAAHRRLRQSGASPLPSSRRERQLAELDSQVHRTPWWSDESEEQRLEGFVRQDSGFHLEHESGALSPAVVIHARKSATWYD